MTVPNRREFIRNSALTLAAAALPLSSQAASQASTAPKLNIFSKHLQFLDFPEMAKAAKDMGFAGVDLTVRPRGHVSPETVETNLPRAVEAIHAQGLETPMMTTAIEDAENPLDQQVLKTAAKCGIRSYRMNWFKYDKALSMPDALLAFQKRIQNLSTLNEEHELVGCYQNHAGTLVGSSLWEVWKLLEGSNPDHFGAQYDIRHATVEGGRSWSNGFKLIQPRIKTIALKDFKWVKKGSRTEILNTPLGEGMVNLTSYFRLLKTAKIKVPISLHLEYDLGGAEKGRRTLTKSPDFVFEAMRKDIATFKRLWTEA